MADPFSIAGTAVGITSLGLQIFQGLFQYYAQFRGLHDDIDDILRRVEGLEGILKTLEPLIRRYESSTSEAPSQLQLALTACEKALQRLKLMTEKCGKTRESDSLQDRLRLARKRLLWPFKKDTLHGLHDTLNSFQDNLSLALQSLGLHDILCRLEDIQGSATVLVDRAIRIEDQVGMVNENICQLSSAQHQHNSHVNGEMAILRADLTAQTAAIEKILGTMTMASNSFRDPSRTSSGFLLEVSQAIEHTAPRFRKSLRRYNALQDINGTQMKPSSCTCSWPYGKRECRSHWRWMTLRTKESYTHEPDCPCHAYADFSKVVEARFITKLYCLQYYVQIGWQVSRERGWRNIQPILRYRNVVANDSPVFALIGTTRKKYIFQQFEERYSQEELEGDIHAILDTFRRSIGVTASPTDVDRDGKNIIRATLDVLEVFGFGYLRDTRFVCSFIDSCLAEGVLCDEGDNYGSTPIHTIQMLAFGHPHIWDPPSYHKAKSKNLCALLNHLARRSETWTVYNIYSTFDNLWFTYLAELLSVEEVSERLDEEDPLSYAIFRRSETEFSCQIKASDPGNVISSFTLRNATTAGLVQWAAGVEILFLNIHHHAHKSLLDTLWPQSLDVLSLNTMLSLLDFGAIPAFQHWEELHSQLASHLIFHSLDWSKEQYIQLCFAMIQRYLDLDSKKTIHEQNSSEIDENPKAYSLYHSKHLSLIAAKCLWDSGYHDIDTVGAGWVGTTRFMPEKPKTPLWIQSMSSYPCINWPLIEWLLDKGANVSWVQPDFNITPAHILAGYLASQGYKGSFKTIDTILMCDKIDQCTCCCSYLQSGCYAIGCAVRKHSFRWSSRCRHPIDVCFEDEERRDMEVKWYDRESCLRYAYALVDTHTGLGWMSSAILRVMTFDELPLTHTCCWSLHERFYDVDTRPTKEAAKEIHDIQREDINLLDTLMEEFEARWNSYEGKFSTFIKRVWKQKMKSVRKQKKKSRLQQKDLDNMYRDTGVKLSQGEDNHLSDSEDETSDSEDDDSGSSDDEFESASESGGREEEPASESGEQDTSQ